MISDFTLFLACLYAGSITLLICLSAPAIGAWTGMLDAPGGRKLHLQTTPLMGGLALLTGLVPIHIGFMLTHEPEGIGHWALASFATTMFCCAALGMFDDRRHIAARWRFLAVLIMFGALLVVEPRFGLRVLQFEWLAEPIRLGAIGGWIFSVLVLLGFLNAVNMADGKNGLVIGMGIIWAAVIVASGPIGLKPVLIPLIAILAVLLAFNLSGRLFLGDGGTYGLSAIISLAATYSYNYQAGLMRADQLILLFLVPIADMMRLIVQRRLNGRSPMEADRNHLHHYLMDRFGWPAGLVVYLALVAIPNAIGVMEPDWAPCLVIVTLAIYSSLVFFASRSEASPVSVPVET